MLFEADVSGIEFVMASVKDRLRLVQDFNQLLIIQFVKYRVGGLVVSVIFSSMIRISRIAAEKGALKLKKPFGLLLTLHVFLMCWGGCWIGGFRLEHEVNSFRLSAELAQPPLTDMSTARHFLTCLCMFVRLSFLQ